MVGFKFTGRLPEGATATDLVLTVTEMLRKEGRRRKVRGVPRRRRGGREPRGSGHHRQHGPEYGATIGIFPVDDESLRSLRQTGRSEEQVDLVERYMKEQGLFRTEATPEPTFSDTVSLDLSTVQPSLAGPKRPQDRVLLSRVKSSFLSALKAPIAERGFALDDAALKKTAPIKLNGRQETIGHGAVVIAAITSCTNTSNPSVMIAAGLLAKKACERGLSVKPHVKTSLAGIAGGDRLPQRRGTDGLSE